MIEQLQQIANEAATAKAAFIERAKTILSPALLSVFATVPEIHSFRWTQYTPHFNDGEPCEFGVHGLEFKLATAPAADADEDADDEEYEEAYYYESIADPEGITRDQLKFLHGISKTLGDMEDVLQSAFGDGVRVTVTREGVDVDEYDHD